MPHKAVIDNLPKRKRQDVLDALLRGESLRKVAKLAGVSHQSIDAYKRKVVMPAIRTAQKVQRVEEVSDEPSEVVEDQTRLTKAIVSASPFRERLEKLWGRVDRNLDQVEQNKELALIAPLLNQAHRNVELLGRVTGELEVAAPSTVAIQIVMPVAESKAVTGEPPTIDIAVTR